jgi:hypothetical protein
VRVQLIVSNVRLLFQTLAAKQTLEFVYASAARQSWKNGRQLPPASIGAAVKIVN